MITSVHFTNAYHATSGGVRTFYHALLDAAPAAGRRVVLVVPGERDSRKDLGSCAAIYSVRAPSAPAFDRRYRLILPTRYLFSGSAIVRILRAEQPALVEISDKYSLSYIAGLIRRRFITGLRRPALIGLSHERLDDGLAAYVASGRVARTFARWYVRNIYGPPFDRHFAVSEFTAAELRDAMPDRPADFIRAVPIGVDSEAFHPSRRCATVRNTLLAKAGGTSSSTLLLYAGRVAPEKNIPLLLATLRQLAHEAGDYRLVIAGQGPALQGLLRDATDLAGRIHCCGHLQPSDLADAYASADVFVHPNPREPFGIGPLEAMASGVPVVLPDAGGVLEYATPANAYLASPTPSAFATAIVAAIRDTARVAEARATAARFSWGAAAARYFAEYDAVIARFADPALRRTYAATAVAAPPLTELA